MRVHEREQGNFPHMPQEANTEVVGKVELEA